MSAGMKRDTVMEIVMYLHLVHGTDIRRFDWL